MPDSGKFKDLYPGTPRWGLGARTHRRWAGGSRRTHSSGCRMSWTSGRRAGAPVAAPALSSEGWRGSLRSCPCRRGGGVPHPVVPRDLGPGSQGDGGEGSALLGTDRWRRVGAPGLVLIGFRSIEGRPAAAASSAIPRTDACALEGHGQQEAGESCINAGLNTSPRPRVMRQ